MTSSPASAKNDWKPVLSCWQARKIRRTSSWREVSRWCSISAVTSVTTTSSTPPGNYTVTITGQSGDLTRTTAVGLTVGTAPAPSQTVAFDNAVDSGFHWSVTSVTTPAFVVGSGANRAAMIMVAMNANNATNITASPAAT